MGAKGSAAEAHMQGRLPEGNVSKGLARERGTVGAFFSSPQAWESISFCVWGVLGVTLLGQNGSNGDEEGYSRYTIKHLLEQS